MIADEDFRLRGGGDLLGTRQSGAPGFRLADPVEHEGLLHMAHRDAAVLLEKDPKLTVSAGRRCACCCGCSTAGGRWRVCRPGSVVRDIYGFYLAADLTGSRRPVSGSSNATRS